MENTIDRLTLIAYSASKLFNPTTILLEHALLVQGFMEVQKATSLVAYDRKAVILRVQIWSKH